MPVPVESQVQGSSREEPSGRVAMWVALFHVKGWLRASVHESQVIRERQGQGTCNESSSSQVSPTAREATPGLVQKGLCLAYLKRTDRLSRPKESQSPRSLRFV